MALRPPQVCNHYVGHDNNRDWYIFSLPETRATAGLENLWHPQIVYDVHQMGSYTARMFVPPWLDPVDLNIDPPPRQPFRATHWHWHGHRSCVGRQDRRSHQRHV